MGQQALHSRVLIAFSPMVYHPGCHPTIGGRNGCILMQILLRQQGSGTIPANEMAASIVTDGSTQKRPKTQPKMMENMTTRSKTKLSEEVDCLVVGGETHEEGNCSNEQEIISYWSSGDAARVFGLAQQADDDDNDMPVRDIVQLRIECLKDGYLTSTGWRQVVDHEEDDYTEMDIFRLRRACKYMATALVIALERLMPGKFTWMNCCELAIGIINRQESRVVVLDPIYLQWELYEGSVRFLHPLSENSKLWLTSPRNLMQLHKSFRVNRERFQNRHRARNGGQPPLPPLLDRYPEVKEAIIRFSKENLNHLSSERVYSYMHEHVLPSLVHTRNNEVYDATGVQGTLTVEDLLRECGLVSLSVPTIYRWMKRLGFKYAVRRKCYYVDTHEKPENQLYRKGYVRAYRKLELRMFRWIQLRSIDFQMLKGTKKFQQHQLVATGFPYRCTATGMDMIEFHVDDHPMFQESMQGTKFGGALSVRNPNRARPLIAMGQDECIFKQYLFTSKVWMAPDGTKALVPKDEGLGVMISAIVSREFGLWFEISDQQLAQVNAFRREHANCRYRDSEAAIKKFGTDMKHDLTQSPFLVEFEYGVNGDGYWTYESMILQVEDCIDVVQSLYPEYDFLFQFDHSCGHDRKKPDGLNALSVRKGYSDNQPRMRDSKIEDENHLGPYNATVSIGDTYMFNWGDNPAAGEGPCWMTAEERLLNRDDRPNPNGGTETYKYKKEELVAKLSERSLTTTGNKSALVSRCRNHGIPISEERPTIIKGWRGNPKGAFQILWERGFLSTNRYSDYTMGGRVDPFGIVIPESGLKTKLAALPDFQQEKTLLQHHAEGRSVQNGQQILLLRSPKCHPEVAGEGIEYAWAVAKQWYRRLPLTQKRTKENFRKNVTQSLKNITVEAMRSMSKRAREYIVSYDTMARWKDIHGDEAPLPESTAQLLDKIVDRRRSHRAVSWNDNPWVKKIMESMISSPEDANPITL